MTDYFYRNYIGARFWPKNNKTYNKKDWNNSNDPYSMIEFTKNNNVDFKKLILAKIAIVRQIEHLLEDYRSISALNIAESFAKGEKTEEEFKDAIDMASYAYASTVKSKANIITVMSSYAAYIAIEEHRYAPKSNIFSIVSDILNSIGENEKCYFEKSADLIRHHISFEDFNVN